MDCVVGWASRGFNIIGGGGVLEHVLMLGRELAATFGQKHPRAIQGSEKLDGPY